MGWAPCQSRPLGFTPLPACLCRCVMGNPVLTQKGTHPPFFCLLDSLPPSADHFAAWHRRCSQTGLGLLPALRPSSCLTWPGKMAPLSLSFPICKVAPSALPRCLVGTWPSVSPPPSFCSCGSIHLACPFSLLILSRPCSSSTSQPGCPLLREPPLGSPHQHPHSPLQAPELLAFLSIEPRTASLSARGDADWEL